LELAHCHRDFVRGDTLNVPASNEVPHGPNKRLGGKIRGYVANHGEQKK
jgi:hypothetical protein